jgi:hypothetical protein
MAEKGGKWIDANDPTTEWDLLHESFKSGDKNAKFAALSNSVSLAIKLAKANGVNVSILQELEMQLFDKDMGSKSTALDKKMPLGGKRRKALRPSQDMKRTFAVGAIEAFRKAGLTQEKAIAKVSMITGYSYDKIDHFRDYYFRDMPDGYSYLSHRLDELKGVSTCQAEKLGYQWSELAIGLD